MSALVKAHESWGALPDWVVVLAKASDRTSQAAVARLLGINSGYISYALRNEKPQYHQPVEYAVRGKLMAETIACPVLGEIDQSLCVRHRKNRVPAVLPEERQLRTTCPTCIHNIHRKETDHAE